MLLNEVFQPKKLTEWPLPGRAPVVGKPVRNDDGTMTVSVGKRNYLLRPIETDFGRPTMKPVEQWEVISPSGKQIAVYPSAYSAYAWIRLVAKANKLIAWGSVCVLANSRLARAASGCLPVSASRPIRSAVTMRMLCW